MTKKVAPPRDRDINMKALSKRDMKMIEIYVTGVPLYLAAQQAGYTLLSSKTIPYRRIKEKKAKEYLKKLREEVLHVAGLDCRWFLKRCMTTFDTCCELIDDGKGGLKVRDSGGAAKMGAIIKEAIPDFKQRLEHTITESQVFKIGDQEIRFE